MGVAAGHTHSAVVSSNGHLYVWGANEHGQLGLGTAEATPTPTRVPLDKRYDIRGVAVSKVHTVVWGYRYGDDGSTMS